LCILGAKVENQNFFRHGDAKVKKIPQTPLAADGVWKSKEAF